MRGPSRRISVVLFILVLVLGVSAADAQGPRVKLRLGFASIAHLEHVPALLVAERLRVQGIALEPTFFAQEVLSLQAVIRGDMDMGNGASVGSLAAIQQGAKLKFFVTESRNPWTLYAKKEVARCEDLSGKRLALHSQGGISTALTKGWLKEHCPTATPNILIIPGSERRAVALVAGQIDLTPLELSDAKEIERTHPGQFHFLADFSKEVPWLLGSIFYSTPQTLSSKRDLLKTYVRELIKINRLAARNPETLAAVAPKYLYKQLEPGFLLELTKGYVEGGVWPTDGGFTPQSLARTIQFFVDIGSIKPGLKAEDVGDYTIIREVLEEIGK